MNEPSAGHETWLAETVGDSINWNSFKWAHETDPDAKLYVNDFNIIVWGAAPEYHTLIKDMLDHGAPIDGIGVQGHMAGSIDWSDIKTKIDYMSDLGLPIRVTEFDMEIDANNVSEQTQANEYAEMMRTIFSHPSMNGFVFWSISDKDAWRDGSGIYTENRVPKIAADTVYHLIHEKWSTNLKMKANLQDTFKFRGFYGFYNVVVDYGNGVVKEFKIDATKAGGDSVFVLNYAEGSAVAPVLKQVAQSKDGRGVILTFDRAINPQTVKKEDFHLFMGDETTIDSVIKVSEDSTVFQICLKDTVKYRQFASLIYDGDTVATADGAQLPFFGPETIENKLPGFRFAETDTSGSEIVLGFSKEMNSTIPVSEFKIYVNGVSVSILSADYNTDGNIVFQLSGKVTWEDLITISYQKGTFTSADEYILYSFGPKFVENNVSAPVNSTLSVDISKLILFPNPASNELNLSGLVSKSNVTIQLVNMEGKNLLSTYMKAEQTDVSMDIHSLLAGMYICRIMDDNGKVICLKEFVKQ